MYIIAIVEAVVHTNKYLLYSNYKYINTQIIPYIGVCAHFSEKSKVGSQAFSYNGFRRVLANKKAPQRSSLVGDNNPYVESLFRMLKYVPSWPSKGFASLEEESRAWVDRFVEWYNNGKRSPVAC